MATAGVAAGQEGEARQPTAAAVEAAQQQCDFEARPDMGRDRWAVFVVASK